MPPAPASRILLCAADPAAVEDLRQLLERAGHAASRHGLHGLEDLTGCDLVVLEAGESRAEALHFLKRLRHRLADGFVPLLVTSDHAPDIRRLSLESGADACLLRPFSPEEVLAQVQALLRIKEVHDQLSQKSVEAQRVNKRLQQTYQQIDQELELARRIQQSFLPPSLPEVPRARFAVHYQPCGRVGGDFYDAFRLDENHVGFYVADAMGHGVPASLLTIFLKKGVRAKEISGQQYRLVPPGEVLQRLNRDLIDQGLSENPFITMVYGLFDCREGTLHFARAGHPHPLHVPGEGEPQLWQVRGSLLGVFETDFPVQTQQIRPGEKVLFYTDGIDGASFEGHAAGMASLQASAGRHRALPVQEFVERIAGDMVPKTGQSDDFTMLGLEVLP